MSVSSFIKFLHKKKILPEDKILDVIDKTLHSKRSMIRYIMDNDQDHHKNLLKLCFHAIEEQSDLITAQKKHGIFDQKIFDELMNGFKKEQRSVSSVLVSEGFLKTKDLEALLLEFAQAATGEEENVAPPASSKDEAISDAALESLRELAASGNLDPEILAELEAEKKKS